MPARSVAQRANEAFGDWPATADTETTATDLNSLIGDALALVADNEQPAETRAALYEVLYRVHSTIARGLGIGARGDDNPQAELAAYMDAMEVRSMGGVELYYRAEGVTWPVNDPANWGDYGLQGELSQFAKMAPRYIRHVPEHWELDTAALRDGMSDKDDAAFELHKHAKLREWRTETGRRPRLRVRGLAA